MKEHTLQLPPKLLPKSKKYDSYYGYYIGKSKLYSGTGEGIGIHDSTIDKIKA